MQEPLLAAEALLGLGLTKLGRGELDEATSTFLAAGRQFQLLESTSGDGSAMLGLAQTLIGQQRWDEAAEQVEGALIRFRQSDDLVGQADAQLALGLAKRGSGENEDAATHFEQALTLYQQQHQPLGQADAHFERGDLFLETGTLDQAQREFSHAISLVEGVMQSLRTPEQWATFLQQYAELYTQAAITEVRRNQDEQAYQVLHSFTRIAGKTPLLAYMKAYEDTLPTEGENLTEEERQENANILRRIRKLRDRL